jgi:hypothetical protein
MRNRIRRSVRAVPARRAVPAVRAARAVRAVLARTAFATAFAFCCLIAGATPASAQVTITIQMPSASLPQEGDMAILVDVTSPTEVTSVHAAVGTRTTALVTSAGGHWTGTLSLDGLPSGQHQMTVTATNAATQTQQATRTFTLDRRPVITVTSPVNGSLAEPDVRITATCTDDGPICRMAVAPNLGPLLAAGNGSIDTVIRPPDGLQALRFTAQDSTGRSTEQVRNVLVISTNKLAPLASYQGASILDLHADRALVYDDFPGGGLVLRIVNRATNASQTIWTPNATEGEVTSAHLTPGGAIFIIRNSVDHNWYLREWRGGAIVDLGQLGSTTMRVKGQWAIYTQYSFLQAPLILRDLIAGTNTIVDPVAGNIDNDVTTDGRVIYWDYTPAGPYQIYEYDPGPPPATTPLTAHPTDGSVYPLTDDVNIVFARVTQYISPMSIILRAGDGTETVLATHPVTSITPGDYYRIAAGWVAFTRPGNGGSIQVWLRAPDGTERQLSSTGGVAKIKGLSDTGEVIFDTAVNPPLYSQAATTHRRYLARPDGTIVDLGEPIGKVHRINGAWYVAEGGHILALQPEAPARSILSEGATGTFFTTDVAILNPHDSAVPVTIRYLRENAPELQETRTLPALSRTTIHENEIAGLEGASVSTVVEAPGTAPVVVERLMTWDQSGYGGHLGSSVDRPRVRWMFAEGAQGVFFRTFFLLANSGATTAKVKMTFLIEEGTPVTIPVDVEPGARKTLYAAEVNELNHRSFATVIDSDVPIVAERAMYFGDSPLWLGGHGSAGVPEPAHKWFHAEGATGSLFDTYILLSNPHPVDVNVAVYYTTDTGQVIFKPRTLRASTRLTINVEDEGPELAVAAFSTRVESSSFPMVSERAMYWGTTGAGWREAHNSFGVTESGVKWGLAEGRAGGTREYQTYVLVSNTTNDLLKLRATYIKEDGTTVTRTYDVAASTRYNINTADITELANSNFSTIVESTNGVLFNVESAIYWNANGVIWEGGGNTVATKLQ